MNTIGSGASELNTESTDDSEGQREGGLSVTRRQALAALGAAGGAGLLGFALLDRDSPGNGSPSGGPTTDGPVSPTPSDEPAEHLPYAVWEEIRAALETSPDHLPARAEALVKAGDPEAVFSFVRDEILTLPTGLSHVGRWDVSTPMYWGPRGTLRGGGGTPREKAELLADLFSEMGLRTAIVEADIDLSDDEITALYLRDVDRPFEPDITDEQRTDWIDRLGLDSEDIPSVERLDPDGVDSVALAASLLDAYPEDRQYSSAFGWGMTPRVPVVRFRAEDEETDRYANLFADAPFGEAGTETIREIADASVPDVTVALSAARADAPSEPFELVSKTWSAEDVVGRQVVVRTLPGIDPLERPDIRFNDIRAFVPALTVQGGDIDQQTSEELSTLGDAVTRGGDRLSVEEDGTVSRNGVPLAATGDVSAAERVRSVSITPDPSRYPEVRLDVVATDANGDNLEGLPANAFELREEERPAAVTLQSNRATPRVMVLYDTSSSMPAAYSGVAMEEFVADLTGEIESVDPDARIELVSTGSDIWTSAAEAASSDANVIVYATDGDVTDSLTPEIEQVLRAGPPIVMLSVKNETEVTVPAAIDIAAFSGGKAVPAQDRTAAREAIRSFVADIADVLAPYELIYGSPVDGTGGDTHRVSVTVGDATGTATYTVPETALTPPNLSSLWLEVTVGDRSTTRLLAGYDPRIDGREVTEEMLAAVEGALFGSTTLSFEGVAPSLSLWLDDFLAAKGSTAALDTALAAEDDEAIQEATAAGLSSVPPEIFLLTSPFPDAVSESSLTFADGMRVAAYTHHPVFGSNQSRVTGDILPLTRYNTATRGENESEAFRLTMERTARMAVAETAGFEASTQTLIGDTPLVLFEDIDYDAWGYDRYTTFNSFRRNSGHAAATGMGHWTDVLVPEDGSVLAYWHIDRESGAVLGVLPDGTNGGSSTRDHERTLQGLSQVISGLNLLFATMGVGGLAVGVVAAYGQVLARLYAAVAMALEVMDASGLDAAIAEAKVKMVCEIAKAAFLDVVYMGSIYAAIEDLIGAVGGTSRTSC